MSVERSIFVLIPDSLAKDVLQLNQRATACLARSAKMPPGDRTEAVRFENLHLAIDQIAIAVWASGAAQVVLGEKAAGSVWSAQKVGSSLLGLENVGEKYLPKPVNAWLQAGGIVVELNLPHGTGKTGIEEMGRSQPVMPANRWYSNARKPWEAIEERFENSIKKALAEENTETFVSPSGVSNQVLTNMLHKFSQVNGNKKRRDVSIVYRDGSTGPDFPLQALKMKDKPLENARVIKFSLLSIRHVEMDSFIDGAWLRNSRISRTRQSGLTDQIVFDISKKQLLAFDPKIPTFIEMYQTGLEPAIMGFYRAVVLHLLKFPKSIAVRPQYFVKGRPFEPGKIWTV